MKNSHIKKFFLIVGVVSFVSAAILTYYLSIPNNNLIPGPKEAIDELVLGVRDSRFGLSDIDYVSAVYDEENKDYCDLAKYAHTLLLPITKDDTGTYTVDNKCGITDPVSLKVGFSDIPVNVEYDHANRNLRMFSPANRFVFNDQLIDVPERALYSTSLSDSDLALSVCDGIYPLSTYQNDLALRLSDLGRCNIQVITNYGKASVLDKDKVVFSADNWSNSHETIPALSVGGREAISVDDVGYPDVDTVEVSSMRNMVYVTKEFDTSFEQFEEYNISFNYALTMQGDSIAWGYRFITQEYKEDLEKLRKGEQINKISTNTNESVYPTSEEYFEQYVPETASGHINCIIKTKLENVIGIQIFLYSRSPESVTSVKYSNLQITEVEKLPYIDFTQAIDNLTDENDSVTIAEGIFLKDGLNRFGYEIAGENLLSSFNYSFENRTWDTQIDYSKHNCTTAGVPMPFLIEENADSTDGSKSMYLLALFNRLCTQTVYPVGLETSANYLFTFDYKNISGNRIGYGYRVAGESNLMVNSTLLGAGDLNIVDVKSQDWTQYVQYFTTNFNQTHLSKIPYFSVMLSAPSDATTSVTNLYDNIGLYKLKYPVFNYSQAYFQISQSPAIPNTEITITSNSRGAGTSFSTTGDTLLMLNKPYSSSLKIQNLSENKHFIYNGVANLWFIGNSGDYILQNVSAEHLVYARAVMIICILLSIAGYVLLGIVFAHKFLKLCDRVIRLCRKTPDLISNMTRSIIKVVDKANSFVFSKLIKPVMKLFLGDMGFPVKTIFSSRSKLLNEVDSMAVPVINDLIMRPLFWVIIVFVSLMIGHYTRNLYTPFIIIFLMWLVYAWDSRILAIGALIQLFIVACLLVISKSTWAENFAISVYFFLVMTVIMQLIEYCKEKDKIADDVE